MRRLAAMLPTVLGITIVAFLILNLLPHDPILIWSGEGPPPSAELMQRLREELRPDEGPLARYGEWLLALARGDLGRSIKDGRPVGAVVLEALPWTLLLNLCAVLAIYGLAIPFGLLGAASPGSAADRLGLWTLLALYALPSFAAALLLQQVFAVGLGLLPLHGVTGPGEPLSPAGRAADLARHLVLPTACLALSGWAYVARYARAVFRTVLAREYIAVARSKGLTLPRAFRHVAANAAIPFVTLVAAIIPGLIGGSVIVEQIFSWPGMGRLYLAAVEGRDYPVVMGLTLMSATAVAAGHLVVDLLYLAVDPRMRESLLRGAADA